MSPADPITDLQPSDERAALCQRLDAYRAVVASFLDEVTWAEASSPLLPATDLTVAGIVKHLAWVEDHWFCARLLGDPMPPPWDAPGADDQDASTRLDADDTLDGIATLYAAAGARSRTVTDASPSLDRVAALPSFGRGPVNLRWILAHMIDETARHAGHLDLLTDTLRRG